MYQQGYDPRRDYWRKLRDAIVDMHENARDKSVLDQVLQGLDSKKDIHYRTCVASYKRWVGRKSLVWIGTHAHVWQSGNISVRVNPELGLAINGVEHLVKLYFKSEALSRHRVDVLLLLLSSAATGRYSQAKPAVLDVHNGSLISSGSQAGHLSALLAGEAAAFEAMWVRV